MLNSSQNFKLCL